MNCIFTSTIAVLVKGAKTNIFPPIKLCPAGHISLTSYSRMILYSFSILLPTPLILFTNSLYIFTLTNSKIIFSKNCPSTYRYITSKLNINPTNTFRKYLGFPILNHKPKPVGFPYIIDNLRNNRSGWQTNFLIPLERTTLTLANMNIIPNQSMQYIQLPRKPLRKLIKSSGTLYVDPKIVIKNYAISMEKLSPFLNSMEA